MMNGRKTIGILGGMGPAATSELFSKIIHYTKVKRDQEHIRTIVMNDPTIPDRTEYILGKGPNPIPHLINNIQKLSQIGADMIAIPCMTAHSFISELEANSPIPIINAIELVERHLNNDYPKIERIGLLATNGTIKSGVFHKYISKDIYIPDQNDQKALIEIIYGDNGIKAGNTSDKQVSGIKRIVSNMEKYNIQAVIAGCTELSLVMSEQNVSLPVIDPITLLAEHIVKIGRIQQ